MFITCVVVSVLAAAMAALSAVLKLRRAPNVVTSIHHDAGVPLGWFPFLALLELAAAVGIIVGLNLEALGVAAAAGLALYAIGAAWRTCGHATRRAWSGPCRCSRWPQRLAPCECCRSSSPVQVLACCTATQRQGEPSSSRTSASPSDKVAVNRTSCSNSRMGVGTKPVQRNAARVVAQLVDQIRTADARHVTVLVGEQGFPSRRSSLNSSQRCDDVSDGRDVTSAPADLPIDLKQLLGEP